MQAAASIAHRFKMDPRDALHVDTFDWALLIACRNLVDEWTAAANRKGGSLEE